MVDNDDCGYMWLLILVEVVGRLWLGLHPHNVVGSIPVAVNRWLGQITLNTQGCFACLMQRDVLFACGQACHPPLCNKKATKLDKTGILWYLRVRTSKVMVN